MAEAGVFRPGERVELIGGRIVTMGPQNSPHANGHSSSVRGTAADFCSWLCGADATSINLSAFSQPEPDLAVVRGTIRDYTSLPTTALLIVEVSDSTLTLIAAKKQVSMPVQVFQNIGCSTWSIVA